MILFSNRLRLAAFLAPLFLLVTSAAVQAESVASLNRQGNRLFDQGKYQEAEKAYVDAGVESPGRPELLYNLGNALMKQRKYEQALQTLHQTTEKGDKGLQQRSWYNTGNASFEMKRYDDAAQAYIKALRINPADRDAKHNLELALKKMDEQRQSASSRSQENSQQQEDKSQKDQGDQPQQPSGNQNQQAQKPEDQNKPAEPRATSAEQQEGSFSKERALQILDALQSQEFAEQRKLMERRARQKTGARDW
jgi:Ca-activated chloride channel homolog